MEYTHKVTFSKKIRDINIVLICVIGSISLLGLVMAIYSLVTAKFIFATVYIIAVLLGFSHVIMRINSILPVYFASDDEYLYVQTWENGLFPFAVSDKFYDEFIPAKTVLKKIDVRGISQIFIGSKNYIVKIISDGAFREFLKSPDKKYQNMIKKMDFLYIKTLDNQEIYMPVTDFDAEELSELLKPIIENNEQIDFKSNNRILCRNIPQNKITL